MAAQAGRIEIARIDVELWLPGMNPAPLHAPTSSQQAGVTVAQVTLSRGSTLDAARRDMLATFCPGLDEEMINDLLDPDPSPRVDQSPEGITSLSVVHCFSANAADALWFDMLEVVGGDRWLVVARSCIDHVHAPSGPCDTDWSHFMDRIAARWRDHLQCPATASNLGLLILDEQARAYTRSRRELHKRVEHWELEFFTRSGPVREEDRDALIVLHQSAARFYEYLEATHQERITERRGKVWFQDEDPTLETSIDRIVDRNLARLSAIRERVRTLMGQVSSRRSEDLQERLAVGGAMLLVPTLVATIYGANTWLPGQGTRVGFLTLCLLIVLSAGLTLVAFRVWHRLQRHQHDRHQEPIHRVPPSPPS